MRASIGGIPTVASLVIVVCSGRRFVHLQEGIEPTRPDVNADGHIPTMAGDVIVHCPGSEADHLDWQKKFANLVGQIVSETKFLSANERSHEIELRVKSVLAGGESLDSASAGDEIESDNAALLSLKLAPKFSELP